MSKRRQLISRNNGKSAAGPDLPSIALFGAVVTLLTTGSILNWVLGVSSVWTIPVIVASGIAAAWLLLYWYWQFPHMFWRSLRSYRPTTFTQPGLFWRNVIIAMIAGCTLPILAALREVGLSQVLGSMMLGAFRTLFYWNVFVKAIAIMWLAMVVYLWL